MGNSKISRMVREFQYRVEAQGIPFETFLVNSAQFTAEERHRIASNHELYRPFDYRDPTGEEAVHHVVTGRYEYDGASVDDLLVKQAVATGKASAARESAISVEELIPDPDERRDIHVMGTVTDEQFEEVLAEARAEGDLSRENVAQKCKERAGA